MSQERTTAPQTFIGSSSEGLIVANAIRGNLMDVTDCQVWTEGVFLPGRTFIETLESVLERVDFAILVATPDDMLRHRDVESFSMRDNVLLELGLFMAKLGRTRTYLVCPRDTTVRIPTDLLGVTTVDYSLPALAEEAAERLKDPCRLIKQAMKEAEKELSFAMRRKIVKRLLSLTNRVQGFVVALPSVSVRCLADRTEFGRTLDELAKNLEVLASEYTDDAKKLGVQQQAGNLMQAVFEAIRNIPFPEEAVVTQKDLVSGLLKHLGGTRSAEDQVRDRFGRLTSRYEAWWNQFEPPISLALNAFQGALIAGI